LTFIYITTTSARKGFSGKHGYNKNALDEASPQSITTIVPLRLIGWASSALGGADLTFEPMKVKSTAVVSRQAHRPQVPGPGNACSNRADDLKGEGV